MTNDNVIEQPPMGHFISSIVISRELLLQRFPYLFWIYERGHFSKEAPLQKMQTNGFWCKQEIERSDL